MEKPTVREHLTESLMRSVSTVWWLIRIMVPASLTVFILQRTGVLSHIARLLEPVMGTIGLPGGAAMALLSSVLVNLYAVVVMVPALALTQRQLVILSLMCLVAHGYFIELVVTRKTGTSVRRMFFVRTGGAILLAIACNALLPTEGEWVREASSAITSAVSILDLSLTQALTRWFFDTVGLTVRVTLIVTGLLFFTRYLQYVGLTQRLTALVRPVLIPFGLPKESALAWIVANTLGLTYGAAVLHEEASSGRLTRRDGDLLNHHLGIAHSLLEDTTIFAALGAPVGWIIIPRLVTALLAVWERRAERLFIGWYTRGRHH